MNIQFTIGMVLTDSDVQDLKTLNLAVDGTMGGLLIGRSHEEGHIYVAHRVPNGYEVRWLFEGYEYLINAAGTKRFNQVFSILNITDTKIVGETFESYMPPNHIKTIDARLPNGESKLLLLDFNDLQIYNKRATKCFLDTLNKMNNAVYPKMLINGQYDIEFNYEGPIDVILNSRIVDQIPGRY